MVWYSPSDKPTVIRTTGAGALRLPAGLPSSNTAKIRIPWWFGQEFPPPVRPLWFSSMRGTNWPKRLPPWHPIDTVVVPSTRWPVATLPHRHFARLCPPPLWLIATLARRHFGWLQWALQQDSLKHTGRKRRRSGARPIFPTSSHLCNGRPTNWISTAWITVFGQFWRLSPVLSSTKKWRLRCSRCSGGGTYCWRKSCWSVWRCVLKQKATSLKKMTVIHKIVLYCYPLVTIIFCFVGLTF